MKKSVASALRFGALGVKICCAGRLGGAEIARTEWYREGRVPLQTIRADIDFGFFTSLIDIESSDFILFAKSDLSFSISEPFFPIMRPGRNLSY